MRKMKDLEEIEDKREGERKWVGAVTQSHLFHYKSYTYMLFSTPPNILCMSHTSSWRQTTNVLDTHILFTKGCLCYWSLHTSFSSISGDFRSERFG